MQIQALRARLRMELRCWPAPGTATPPHNMHSARPAVPGPSHKLPGCRLCCRKKSIGSASALSTCLLRIVAAASDGRPIRGHRTRPHAHRRRYAAGAIRPNETDGRVCLRRNGPSRRFDGRGLQHALAQRPKHVRTLWDRTASNREGAAGGLGSRQIMFRDHRRPGALRVPRVRKSTQCGKNKRLWATSSASDDVPIPVSQETMQTTT